MNKIKGWQLREWQGKSLEWKVTRAKLRISQFVNEFGLDECYVAFSGGKDSTVLLHITRSLYPEIKGVFANTGLEYPEIVEFVKSHHNIDIIRPSMTFIQVLKKYGYPVPTKETAKNISRYRNTKSEAQKKYRLYGIRPDGSVGRVGVIPKKWHFLINAPFKISDRCCDIMKKTPFKRYGKETGRYYPILGTMAGDSNRRRIDFLKRGCIVLGKTPQCRPLSFWTDDDIWDYIRQNDIKYCSVYDDDIHGTGCIFCMFGVHMEKEPNRFQKLKRTHPRLYGYCMEKLGILKVLDYIGVPY